MKSTFLGKYLVASPEQDSGIGTLMRFRDRLIAQRQQAISDGATGGRIDLLQTFLDARDEHGEPLDMDYVKAEILLVLLAGADTTGTQLQALMMYLMKNPRVYGRLMEELDEVTREGKLSEVSGTMESGGSLKGGGGWAVCADFSLPCRFLRMRRSWNTVLTTRRASRRRAA